MVEMLSYEFMRRAFIVGSVLAIILPCIGFTILLKRLSMMGDTLSHASLAGVSMGLFIGINPLLGSIIICIMAGFFIELISKKLKAYEEISTVIVLASSIGLAGIFSSFNGNAASISSYLFGSIVTISNGEFYLILGVSSLVIIIYRLIYDRFYLCVFDLQSAKLMGINTKLIDFIFTILAAVAISLSAKTIGSLIVSSILVIPVITAMQLAKTYKETLILSIILSVIFVYAGLIISYIFNLKPGSVIVIIAVLALALTMLFNRN